MILSAVLVAAALLAAPMTACARSRLAGPRPVPPVVRRRDADDPLAVAAGLDLLAVCLTAGMTLPAAAAATAPSSPPQLALILQRAVDMLALGVDPSVAWSGHPAPGPTGVRRLFRCASALGDPSTGIQPHCAALLTLARRSASSGVALAEGVAQLAAAARQDAGDAAQVAAARASVFIAGPLGLCFLPAFICLGVIPVVGGLAAEVLGPGFV